MAEDEDREDEQPDGSAARTAARRSWLARRLRRDRAPKAGTSAARRKSAGTIAALSAAAAAAILLLCVAVLSVVAGGRGGDEALAVSAELSSAEPTSDAGAEREPTAVPAPPPPAPSGIGIDGGLTVVPYAQAAFTGMPMLPAEPPLSPAPDPALIENTPAGALPRIGADGRRPRDVYARAFDLRDDRSRIVVIVLDIGLTHAASEAAIRRLPGAVVIAVDAYATHPADWARAARQAGHEILASVPLQGTDAAAADAGPRGLSPRADADVRQQLTAALGRFPGFTGVLLHGGNGLGELGRLAPALEVLRERGLLLIDGVTGAPAPLFAMAARMDLPRARVDAAIGEGDAAAIDRQLASLEQTAREQFVAVATVRATPVALERLRTWIARLDPARYVMAPVSAVAAGVR